MRYNIMLWGMILIDHIVDDYFGIKDFQIIIYKSLNYFVSVFF